MCKVACCVEARSVCCKTQTLIQNRAASPSQRTVTEWQERAKKPSCDNEDYRTSDSARIEARTQMSSLPTLLQTL